jgi:hypothetical protein
MYPAMLLKRELIRRLNGQCRVDLVTGSGLNLLAEKQTGYSCANCPSPCEDHSQSQADAGTGFQVRVESGVAKLTWARPICHTTVHEDTTLPTAFLDAEAIKADPLCCTCRIKQAGGKR